MEVFFGLEIDGDFNGMFIFLLIEMVVDGGFEVLLVFGWFIFVFVVFKSDR